VKKIMMSMVAMGCLAGAVHAEPASGGVIYFVGRIVEPTCIGQAVSDADSSASCHACTRTGQPVAPGERGDVTYQQNVADAPAHSGLDVLDYFVDNMHAMGLSQPKLVTRSYD